ncbi:MAG: segregation/condensation protein A [Candidatus Nanohaloarchaea archaeon]|nr:segregation/condensation protein A [Candidatus Nanohaloarchaea archaeon]
MKAKTQLRELSPERFESHNWRSVLDRLTEDMDPWSIDIVKLAERYRNYLKEADRTDLKIPARMVLTCSILLRMKVNFMQDFRQEQETAQEERWEEEQIEEEPLDLEVPSSTVEPPVKRSKKPRKVTLDELKDALEKAIDIQQSRKDRQEERLVEQDFIDLEEKNIEDKLDELMDRLESYFDEETEVAFHEILEQKDREEKIEKFIHVLHLETDGKIRCKQDQFFGKIQILPEEN